MYQLSCNLQGHEQDVKAVVFVNSESIASASRDNSVILWRRTQNAPGKATFNIHHRFTGHTHFVNSLAYIPPTEEHPNGLIVSGSSDKTINVYDADIPGEPIFTLIGHEDNVCSLAITPAGDIISGSWDKTAKIWRSFKCAHTLRSHSAAVWAVASLPTGQVLTGSADKTIKLWTNEGALLRTFTGHTDCVRGVHILSDTTFVSCANDSTVRIWTLQGDAVGELHGHDSFVYAVTSNPFSSPYELVSCGEDRTVRVWDTSKGAIKQTITLPCTSVWAVDTCKQNGDIVVGASDGVVRVFTQDSSRVANEETLKNYEASVAAHAIPSQQLGSINKDNLPDASALQTPGHKDGQILMVKASDGSVEAHQWSTAQKQWVKIGTVVDAVGSDRKQIYNGKEYDYVFDVDLGDGVMLKLPFNCDMNPYQAAQEFIWNNELTQDYLDQIANFITQNAKGITINSSSAPAGNYDPYTGASRYIPGSSGTTSSAPQPKQETKRTTRTNKHIPLKTHVTFVTGQPLNAVSKLMEFNGTTKTISAEEETALTNLATTLEQSPNSINENDAKSWWTTLTRMAFDTPLQYRFPGLDLLRIVVPRLPSHLLTNLAPRLIATLEPSPDSQVFKKEFSNAVMLALRGLCNLCTFKECQQEVWNGRMKVLQLTKSWLSVTGNKNLRLALISLYLNYTVLSTAHSTDATFQHQLLSQCIEFLDSETDMENGFRALVAIGNLIHSSNETKVHASQSGVRDVLNGVVVNATGKVAEVADEILGILE